MKATQSLRVVAEALAAKLGEAKFAGLVPDCIGLEAEAMVEALLPGQVCAGFGGQGT